MKNTKLIKRAVLFIVVTAFLIFAGASPVFAFTAKSGQTINLTENQNDDIYIFANTVNVESNIQGDVVVAGGRIQVNGNISQDLTAAGGFITADGMVDDDARIAGGNITINGTINHDLIVAGGQVTVSKNAKIGGDLVIAGGTLIMEGQVTGKLIASGGTLGISGSIGKGVESANVGELTISSGAEINGDLNYSSTNKAVIASDAIIKGKVNYTELKQTPKTTPEIGITSGILGTTYIIGKIISFLSLFILGIILILAIPVVFNKFNLRMKKSLGICVGWGAILLFGVPVALLILWLIAVVLFITLIGMGLGIIVISSSAIIAILYAILIFISTIFISFLIGQLILSKSHLDYNKYGVKVLAYLIGLAIVIVIYAIPFIGWFARFAGILFGFGGLIMVMKDWIWGFKKL